MTTPGDIPGENGAVDNSVEDRLNSQASLSDVGLSRLSEGFKAERIALTSNERNMHKQQDGTAFSTIYEEKSAITALAWNPNPHVGGWAAAGMGSGLLRIEDLAV